MALVHGSHSEIYMWGLQDYELTIVLGLMQYAFAWFRLFKKCPSCLISYIKAVKLKRQDDEIVKTLIIFDDTLGKEIIKTRYKNGFVHSNHKMRKMQ